jgi:hypothetical protein
MIGWMVPEAPLERTENGLVARGDGWFVLNARDAVWAQGDEVSASCEFEGEHEFAQVGIFVRVLRPGEPATPWTRSRFGTERASKKRRRMVARPTPAFRNASWAGIARAGSRAEHAPAA